MSMVYQVIARCDGSPPQMMRVGKEPLHFGSSHNADLVLADEAVPPIAGRLFVSSGNQIILFNMGARFTLDGAPVPGLQPTIWKPGSHLQIGAYTLQLNAQDIPSSKAVSDKTPLEVEPFAEDPQSTRPPLIPASRITAAPTGVPEVLPEAPTYLSRRVPPSSVPQTAPQMLEKDVETIREADDSASTDISEVVQTAEANPPQWMGYSPDNQQTRIAPAIIESDTPEERAGFTQFKNWLEQDKLSVQLGLQTVNFAPGERIMLPLSIQNNYSHPLELVVSLVGLPSDWTLVNAPIITLASGELKAFEVVILTRPMSKLSALDAFLNLSDRLTPEIKAQLPLPITLKNQSDLTGRFEQSHTRVPNNIYLTLQNHTLANERVRLSIGPHDAALRVVLPNPEVELAPHQKIRIPIRVDVIQYPYFANRNCSLHISAQQGTRAPLDLATEVTIQPTLLRYILLGVIGVLGAALLLMTRVNSGVSIAATTTPTPSPSPTLTATSSPTPTVIPTATFTEVPVLVVPPTLPPTEVVIPTNTPLSFVDPRSASCQANNPVPDGWTLYVIKGGENLYRIAMNHHISTDELARVNCIPNPKIISSGQQIVVPGGA